LSSRPLIPESSLFMHPSCDSQIGGRFLIGIGVGLAACIAPLYIQELSPTRLRGRMVVLNVVMITLGQVIAYGIGAGFSNVRGGWRWMVGLGAIPAALQLIFLVFLPESRESPFLIHSHRTEGHFVMVVLARILIRRGNTVAAHVIMTKIYAFAKPEEVDLKVGSLQLVYW